MLVMVAVSRGTFKVKPFTDEYRDGWTEGECVDAMFQFFQFIGKKKQKRLSSPSSSQPGGEVLAENLPLTNTLQSS